MYLEQITTTIMFAIVLVSPLLNLYYFVNSLKNKNKKILVTVISLFLYCLFLFLLFITFMIDV